MRTDRFYAGVAVGATTVWLAACAWLLACSAAPPTLQNAAQAADVAAYAALQDDCVAGSANRAAALACIADVRKRWCGPGGELQIQGGCGDAGPEASIPVGPALGKLIDRMFPEANTKTGAVPTAATGAAAVGATPVDAGGQ